jgi:hypothetical protein
VPQNDDPANVRALAVAYLISAVAMLAASLSNESKGLRLLALYGALVLAIVALSTALVALSVLPAVPVTMGFRIIPAALLLVSFIGVVQMEVRAYFILLLFSLVLGLVLTGVLWNVSAFAGQGCYTPNLPLFLLALRRSGALGPAGSPLSIFIVWVLPLTFGVISALLLQWQLASAQRHLKEDPRAVRLIVFTRFLLILGYIFVTASVTGALSGAAGPKQSWVLSAAYEICSFTLAPLFLLHAISLKFDQLDKQLLATKRVEEREQTVKSVLRMCFHDLRNVSLLAGLPVVVEISQSASFLPRIEALSFLLSISAVITISLTSLPYLIAAYGVSHVGSRRA